ncbi:MAG TPA: hypothetical protein VN932_01400 [Rhizomicrobium sp.]|nr:hypothetical protein [Rhizomicrobium sp.]
MDWKLAAAVLAAGVIASFTDWLFMGVLFHDRYNTYPEVWWPQFRERGDTSAILYSTALGFITSAAVVGLCVFAGAGTLKAALTVALLAWAAGPLVVAITNGIWIKIAPAVTFAHCLGYLARFLIAGAAAAFALG